MSYNPTKQATKARKDLEHLIPSLCDMARRGRGFRNWYRDATKAIETVCARYGYDIERFTCALSALSPRVAVRRNVALLEMMTRHDISGPCPAVVGLSDTWRKAWGFLSGAEDTSDFITIGQGLTQSTSMKTGSFAANLLGDEYAVTIDVWMARAFGVDPEKLFGSRPLYWACKDIITEVAGIVGMTPAQAQAAIWHSVAFDSGRLTMGDFASLLNEYFDLRG